MTYKTADRIYETSVTTGTGTYSLDGAVTGFQSFSVLAAGATCAYFATDDQNWEVGIGTVATGPNTLARTTILASSSAGAAVNWGAGTRKIRCGLPASMAIPRTQSKSVAGSSNVALTTDEQRRDFLEFTGALTGNIDVTVDATPWAWEAYNNTTGDFTLTLKVSGQTGVQLLRGDRRRVYCDGTDVRAVGVAWLDNPSRPNLLGNPNWQIDQINEGALYTVNTTDVRGPDFWSGDAVGTGVFKLRTLADPDNAALKCCEVSCTTADAAIGATDRYELWTAVEGYDAAALLLGTSSAVPFLYQFKLKSNAVTGVFGVYFANSAGNRFYAGTITIPDTSEHEYTVPLTGDLSGTWLYTNGIGLRMGLVLAAGSNFQGTAGAWTASTVKTTSAQANFMSANTNIIYLKRGQLITGSVAQAYKPADIQRELEKAQRYYCKTYDQGTTPATVTSNGQRAGSADSGSFVYFPNTSFPVTMRAAPTVTVYSPATGASGNIRNNSTAADVAAAASSIGASGMALAVGLAASGQVGIAHFTATARLS